MSVLSKKKKNEFQSSVLKWYSANGVKYPWCEKRTPYRVLISEFLLVRTKASQVKTVFEQFMIKYPTLDEFLKMEIEMVEEIIKPLGLLFRANYLKHIAEQIKNDFSNTIPDNFSDLKSLQGIGDYTANAILCFGYNQRRPLIDTNYIRLYKRVFNIKSKNKNPKNDKYLWNISEELLPEANYVEFNYATLNLGVNICLNNNPKCKICPVQKICYYYNK